MTTPAAEPKPKRSRRMVLWMVAMPIAILLLALAGANWKTFHLAYAKHLMSSDGQPKHSRGVQMVLDTHLRDGMTLEEVRRLFAPAKVAQDRFLTGTQARLFRRGFNVKVQGCRFTALEFDEDDKLCWFSSIKQ